MTGGGWTRKTQKPVRVGELRHCPWSELPTELLVLIVSRLCLEDNVRLSCVCKKLLCVARSLRVVNQSPWLLSLPDANGVEFFDPSQGKFYFSEIPELRGAKIHCSKDGWVLFSRCNDGSFIFNPFTNAKIDLPSCSSFPRSYVRFALSCEPTSPDCVVFTIRTDEGPHNRGVFTGIYYLGDDSQWTTVRYQNTDRALFRCVVGPVFCNGLFYCLSDDKLVGVFDPQKHTWSILPVPPPNLPPLCHDDQQHRTIYMVEFWGKLLLVTVAYPDKPLIFKLDLPKMKWVEMESLNGATLFVSSRSSLLMIDVPRMSRNSVYFSELSYCGKSSYLFSFDDCRYYPANEWHEMRRIRKAVWIEPPKMSHLWVKELS